MPEVTSPTQITIPGTTVTINKPTLIHCPGCGRVLGDEQALSNGETTLHARICGYCHFVYNPVVTPNTTSTVK